MHAMSWFIPVNYERIKWKRMHCVSTYDELSWSDVGRSASDSDLLKVQING